MSETVIDRAFAAMQAAPEDEAAHLAFYERVADAELYLLLEKEAAADVIEPKVIEGGGENLVLAFDTADRLANFAGDVAPMSRCRVGCWYPCWLWKKWGWV